MKAKVDTKELLSKVTASLFPIGWEALTGE